MTPEEFKNFIDSGFTCQQIDSVSQVEAATIFTGMTVESWLRAFAECDVRNHREFKVHIFKDSPNLPPLFEAIQRFHQFFDWRTEFVVFQAN